MGSLLVNLSFLMEQPTGLATYGGNLYPHIRSLHPVLLTARPDAAFTCQPVPSGMTAEQGSKGHAKRLVWTQTRLPRLYHHHQAKLLFSPIPEAPLWAGCRSVVTVHDFIPRRFPAKRISPLALYQRYYVPQVLLRAVHVIANSEATAQDAMRFGGIPARQITPIPLAYDDRHFRPLGLPTEPYFLYIGRYDPYKNLKRLVAAFAQIASQTEADLWLAGSLDAHHTPAIMAQVEHLGLSGRVKFLDYVPYTDLPILLNRAIALVFPSLWEGFGLPVLEAMACGTPVITSNCASLPEVAGEAALLVDPYQIDGIAAAMRVVATDDRARSQLRAAGLARAQQFSWKKTGDRTIEVLQRYLA
ncbi:MAG: glycosyltransferase family 1 protein [Synechococcales bacterium]|nr:glycosyltransferase family 1 protein [Synechococcales bacterium]